MKKQAIKLEIKELLRETKQEITACKDVDDIIDWLYDQGYKNNEPHDLIIKHLITK